MDDDEYDVVDDVDEDKINDAVEDQVNKDDIVKSEKVSENKIVDDVIKNDIKEEETTKNEDSNNDEETSVYDTITIGSSKNRSKTIIKSGTYETIDTLKEFDSYNMTTLKNMAKKMGLQVTMIENGKRRQYKKDELYNKLKDIMNSKKIK